MTKEEIFYKLVLKMLYVEFGNSEEITL